ncbi:MAG: serine/threonine protein kinase, partial [Actinobacteria bacterium]|nr:serine/threonine protein kinase [Actinomycetota bacterium]
MHVLEGHAERVDALSFSPDGAKLASASIDGSIQLWDVATGDCLCSLQTFCAVSCLAFSHDGSVLAAASGKTVQLWDLAAGEPLRALESQSWVIGVAFSPHGSCLASCSSDRTV